MRILRFDIENDKAISSWVHQADGEHVEIAGGCGIGKTTAASSLWQIANKSKDCLKHGERKGHIILHLGEDGPDLIASREFTKKTNTVKVERADGSPVSISDFKGMISHLSENPHKIAEMKPKERVDTLLKAADLGDVSIEEMDKQIEGAEAARLDAYRKAELCVPGDEPEKATAVDVSAISKELDKAHTANEGVRQDEREIERIIEDGKRMALDIENRTDQMLDLQSQIASLQMEKDTLLDKKEDLSIAYKKRKAAHDKMELIEIAPLKEQLASSAEANAKAAKHEQWKERKVKYLDLMQQRDCADETVKELRESKKDLLENAKWPLEGLSIEDGDVLYNGNLFSNLGQSEQMLVCAALAIKDILAHPLHVVRIDGAESLSKADFKKLQDLFGDNEIQVISTRVCESEPRDGELVIEEKESSDEG